jgi:hypothetical protein
MRTINISGARCFRLQLLRFTLWDGASAPQARNGAGDLLEIIAKGADSRSRQQPGALKQYRRNRTAPSEPRSEYIMAGPARGSPRGGSRSAENCCPGSSREEAAEHRRDLPRSRDARGMYQRYCVAASGSDTFDGRPNNGAAVTLLSHCCLTHGAS